MSVSVIDLINFIRPQVPFTYYSNYFPNTAVDDVAVVKFSGGGNGDNQVLRPTFQILVRSLTPSTAESTANAIFNALHMRTGIAIGTARFMLIRCSNSSPIFAGRDEHDRTIYSINFTSIIDV